MCLGDKWEYEFEWDEGYCLPNNGVRKLTEGEEGKALEDAKW